MNETYVKKERKKLWSHDVSGRDFRSLFEGHLGLENRPHSICVSQIRPELWKNLISGKRRGGILLENRLARVRRGKAVEQEGCLPRAAISVKCLECFWEHGYIFI
ncbi:hypothetical protein CDAR_393071 [Caerostris darwini]|uniref:Uncharacterized protein n=1 Tax=Caerostris darwini TaxID=1538125 RepID=A0AAV4VMV9_9ARAC|nr:hypothetical protein CDAR_393071 [Caerostris darwini]